MKRCLLIAPLETHATIGRIAALAASNVELHVIDVSFVQPQFDFSQPPFTELASYKWLNPLIGRVQYFDKWIEILRAFALIPQSKLITGFLAQEINRIDPSVVVTYYGPMGIYFSRLVKEIDRSLPLISILNLIPSSLYRNDSFLGYIKSKLSTELIDYQKVLGKTNAIICASRLMSDYVSSKYNIDRSRIVVIPDYFSKRMSYKISSADTSVGSNGVIFLGAPERWGATIDDVDDQFLELAESGITVYAGKISSRVVAAGNVFCYNYFSNDDVFSGCLSTFAHQFQASIITYGIRERHQRFKTTLPTRFFSAVSAGLPIAVRAGLFDAVEEYLERFSIGFKYHNATELKSRLSDKSEMALFRNNAIKHSMEYFAENQSEEFENLIASVILRKERV
jgi:hypothetical protein